MTFEGQRIERKEIAREIPVCRDCKRELDAGVPYVALKLSKTPEPPLIMESDYDKPIEFGTNH